GKDVPFGAQLVDGSAALPRAGKQHASIGFGLGAVQGKIAQGTRALLTQELRNPRAGKYTLSVHACGGGTLEVYRDVFLKNFTCKLVVFGYNDLSKDPRAVREFASVAFQPPFADAKAGKYEKFELTAVLKSQDDGAFHLSKGVGVAILVEKTSP